jgi:hypothetical protein
MALRQGKKAMSSAQAPEWSMAPWVDIPALAYRSVGEKWEAVGMPRGSSPRRERQYEHIKDSAKQRGESNKRAEEIAARTVNKERARSGEAKTASRTSTQDISSSRGGGLRSHSGSGGPTYEQLYAEARRRNIKGRSSMNKNQLARELGY